MRVIFLMLALLLGLGIAGAAMINNEVVTVNYFFGQVSLTLFMLILGSALAGAMFMGSLGIFRGINNYMNSQGDRGLKKELQNRVKILEDEKKKMEDELRKQHKEREEAAAKAYDALEDEKSKLEDELRKQQKDHEDKVAKMHNR
ncbi:MAG: lipopolysaccharide assembly protein LapA domain-containing protein [Bacillota bacterium]